MKKAKKLLRNSFAYAPQVLVLFSIFISNVFFPAVAIAQEIPNLEKGIHEVVVNIPLDESEDILDEGISTNIYEEEGEAVGPLFVNGVYTINTVVEGEEYVYPDNTDVRVRFNKVTEEGNLVIKRVVLSEEEKSSLNTTDDYGWDITSSMSNGSFSYDLTLPNTQGNDVEVKYTEDGNTYESIEGIVNEGVIHVYGLEHFTVFVVVNPLPSGTSNGDSCTVASLSGICYDSIQEAVNAAIDGNNDKIFVKEGVYTENITVNKSNLTIEASDRRKYTIIDGSSNTSSPIFEITGDNVTIEGFTIKNGGSIDYGAVYINSANKTKLLKNIFSDNEGDLYIEGGSSTTFRKNILVGENTSTDAWAIWISNSEKNTIKKNNISKKYSPYSAIYVENSNYNKISNNILDKNNIGLDSSSIYSSIYLSNSSNNEITSNTVTNNQNRAGISLNHSSNNNTISDNTIINNNNARSPITPNVIYGSGILVTSSERNTITGNTVKEQNSGIRLEGGSNSTIERNILTENYNGVNFYNANNYKCENNTVKYNEIFKNTYRGIYFQGTTGQYSNYDTTINYNNIHGNVKGIYYDGNDELDATLNWWGHHTGPSGVASGDGDSIDSNITYQEWLCEPYSTNWKSENGVCSIEAPETLGYNVNDGTPPSSPNQLTCTGEYTDINGVSVHWTDVSNGNPNIKYQRQYKVNNGSWIGNEIYSTPYTNYRFFGGSIGNDGIYGSQVRAFYDANSDGQYNEGELASAWSNECSIIYDKTAPTAIDVESLHYEVNGTSLSCSSYTSSYDVIAQWEDSSDTNGVHHYEYQSFNPTTGWIWPNTNYGVEVPTSERAGAFTVGEGTYGFRVRAVDQAGNKSEWSSLDFEDSCQITYDKTAPATPTGLHRRNAQGETFACGDFAFRQSMTPDWDDITNDPTFSHYEYSSFNLGGVQGLDEVRVDVSEFNGNGWVAPEDGVYGFAVRSVDKAGNKSAWAQYAETLDGSCQIKYDSTAPSKPVITNSPNNSFTNINWIDVNWTGGDDQGTTPSGIKGYILRYVFTPANGGPDIDWPTGLREVGNPKTHSGSYGHGEGKYVIYVKTVDNVGNESPESDPFTITYDSTNPTISNFDITIDYLSQYVNGLTGFWVSAKVQDSLSGINTSTCKLDGANANNTWYSNKRCYFTVPASQLLDEQVLGLQISVEDNATNKGSTPTYQRKVDSKYPTPVINIPKEYYGPNMLPEIKGTATDTVSDITDVKVTVRRSGDNKYMNSFWVWDWWANNRDLLSVTGRDNWSFYRTIPNKTNGTRYTVTPYAWDQVHLIPGQGLSDSFVWDSVNPIGTIDALRYDTVRFGIVDVARFITNDNTPTVIGTMEDVLSGIDTVAVSINGTTGTVTQLGNNWQADFTTLPDGDHTITVVITDNAGNTRTLTQALTIDTVAPTATYTHYINGIQTTDPIVYAENLNQLSFTANYEDQTPSSGLYQDSFAIFQAQDDGSFRFSYDDKKAYCTWRVDPNRVMLSGTTYNLTDQIAFTKCIDNLPEGEYYMAHQVYDNATRKDIPSINQFRDVLGLHFIIDNTAPVVDITSHSDNDLVNGTVTVSGTVTDQNLWRYWFVITNSSGTKVAGPGTVYSSDQVVNASFDWNTKNVPDGTYTIKLEARDLADNKNLDSIEWVNVVVDNAPPVVDIRSHEDGDVLSGEVTILGNIVEEHMRNYNLSLNPDPDGLCNKEDTWNFSNRIWGIDGSSNDVSHTFNTNDHADGSYMLRFAARDQALNRDPMANTGSGVSVEIVCIEIDNTPPIPATETGDIAGAQDQKSLTTQTPKTKSNITYATTLLGTGGSDTLAQKEIDQEEQEEEKVLGEETRTCDNPIKITSHLYLDKNRNEIFDENEKGIAGVTIRTYYILNDKEKTAKEVKTDENGYWEAQLCPGEYTIEINQEDLPNNVKTEKEITLKIPEDTDKVELNISAIDTRNFWQKNWYIILIIGTLLLVAIYQIATRKKQTEYN